MFFFLGGGGGGGGGGGTLVLQMGDTIGPRYTAPKISTVSYLFGTFSLLIMGDTERPRYTGFRGLLVRGITALQCICKFYNFIFGFLSVKPVLKLLDAPARETTLT